MLKKAVSKWTIAFLAGFILTAGIISIIILVFPDIYKVPCATAQENEIRNVWLKVEEVKQKPGYETMYFEVKSCVEWIEYEADNLKVKYKTAVNPILYPTNVRWDMNAVTGSMKEQKTYYLKVFEDHVEVMG